VPKAVATQAPVWWDKSSPLIKSLLEVGDLLLWEKGAMAQSQLPAGGVGRLTVKAGGPEVHNKLRSDIQ
jgi:hypothetical protein